MKLNPVAVVFWLFCFLVCFLIGGLKVGLIGLTCAVGLSLLGNLLD